MDGAGLLCVPCVVDVHSDGLEREVLPRPGARLPWEFAILSFEGKLRAAGVTTVFHGASFEEGTSPSTVRTVATTRELCAAVAERGVAAVDHRILHRLDVRSPEGLAALRERLAGASPGDVPALVSHEDHTPGQGQYADRSHYERYVAGTRGLSDGEARDHVDRLIIERDDRLPIRAEALDWLGGLARSGAIRLLGHDPASAAEIDDLVARGGAVAEFPTTLEAAAAARERGLPVVAGAPNVLRGRSHAGNVSGGELAARGLLTALASDYLPSGLLPAAFLLAARGVVSLPAAVALVTAGPAEVAGLTDRGRLGAGMRADLVLVEPGEPWPVIRSVLRAETP
ncbi:alpha-D-ribose 1-methylphosphonate 5-triphosphate diphosphatase [Pseudonocardia xinjiangensis]|uniref:alpha-D-ribose 1-methylphosphonate 5-triphosphate diphosphatase n=1 Tax=Pseudonocardia xinjiangensis TaxID=75289 RepID=UPI003D9280E7